MPQISTSTCFPTKRKTLAKLTGMQDVSILVYGEEHFDTDTFETLKKYEVVTKERATQIYDASFRGATDPNERIG